jgi:hypothetical protein
MKRKEGGERNDFSFLVLSRRKGKEARGGTEGWNGRMERKDGTEG